MTAPHPIIHVVDDDDSFRTSVLRLLKAAGYEVRGYPSASEFLLAKPGSPGCIVLDIRLPGLSGLDLQEAFSGSQHSLPIVFLTGRGDISMSVRAMKGGAVDFLTKPVKKEALLTAILSALTQDADIQERRQKEVDLRSRLETLSPRERAVFDSVVAGKLNKQIAMALGISERTVKAHRAQLMEKLDADSLAELIHIAEQLPVRASAH